MILNYLVRYDSALLLSGDISGFIASVYSGLLGQYFAGAMLVTIFVLSYLRTNEIMYGSILWILVSGSMEIMIPTVGFGVSKLFLILGVASGLYSLFSRGRRSP